MLLIAVYIDLIPVRGLADHYDLITLCEAAENLAGIIGTRLRADIDVILCIQGLELIVLLRLCQLFFCGQILRLGLRLGLGLRLSLCFGLRFRLGLGLRLLLGRCLCRRLRLGLRLLFQLITAGRH